MCSAPLYLPFLLLGGRYSVPFIAEHRQLYINLSEYSEYVSLQDRDEDLESEEHHRRGHADDRHKGPEVQDEAEKDEDDQVARQNVGVEPQRERERLGELLEELDEPHERDHDRLPRQTRGHEALEVRPGAVAPEAFVLGKEERQDRERQGEGDVARHRVTVRGETDDVEHQQEDEERERVGEPLPPLLAHLPAEVVAAEAVDLFDDHLVRSRPVLEDPARDEQDEERNEGPDPQEPDGLVYGDVDRTEMQRDHPGVPGTLPGMEDLLPYLLLGQLLYQRQLSYQDPTLRPSRSPAEPLVPGFTPGSLLVLATLNMAVTFSTAYTPAKATSMGTTGHSPRYAGIPNTTAAKASFTRNDPTPISNPAAMERPANNEMVIAVETKIKIAAPAP